MSSRIDYIISYLNSFNDESLSRFIIALENNDIKTLREIQSNIINKSNRLYINYNDLVREIDNLIYDISYI